MGWFFFFPFLVRRMDGAASSLALVLSWSFKRGLVRCWGWRRQVGGVVCTWGYVEKFMSTPYMISSLVSCVFHTTYLLTFRGFQEFSVFAVHQVESRSALLSDAHEHFGARRTPPSTRVDAKKASGRTRHFPRLPCLCEGRSSLKTF
jgi:hypothetical protein